MILIADSCKLTDRRPTASIYDGRRTGVFILVTCQRALLAEHLVALVARVQVVSSTQTRHVRHVQRLHAMLLPWTTLLPSSSSSSSRRVTAAAAAVTVRVDDGDSISRHQRRRLDTHTETSQHTCLIHHHNVHTKLQSTDCCSLNTVLLYSIRDVIVWRQTAEKWSAWNMQMWYTDVWITVVRLRYKTSRDGQQTDNAIDD